MTRPSVRAANVLSQSIIKPLFEGEKACGHLEFNQRCMQVQLPLSEIAAAGLMFRERPLNLTTPD